MPRTRHRRKGREGKAAAYRARARRRAAIRSAVARMSHEVATAVDEIAALRMTWREYREAVQTMERTGRYKDFDAAMAELEDITVTVKGEDYLIPGDPPAAPLLEIMAAGRLTDESAVPEILDIVVGEQRMQQMLSAGMGIRQMNLLVNYLMKELGFEDDLSTQIETVLSTARDAGREDVAAALEGVLALAKTSSNGQVPEGKVASASTTS